FINAGDTVDAALLRPALTASEQALIFVSVLDNGFVAQISRRVKSRRRQGIRRQSGSDFIGVWHAQSGHGVESLDNER
ncbi:MAG: hypothetical protein ACKOEV_15405, partial [Cytophagales bacterium]